MREPDEGRCYPQTTSVVRTDPSSSANSRRRVAGGIFLAVGVLIFAMLSLCAFLCPGPFIADPAGRHARVTCPAHLPSYAPCHAPGSRGAASPAHRGTSGTWTGRRKRDRRMRLPLLQHSVTGRSSHRRRRHVLRSRVWLLRAAGGDHRCSAHRSCTATLRRCLALSLAKTRTSAELSVCLPMWATGALNRRRELYRRAAAGQNRHWRRRRHQSTAQVAFNMCSCG